MEAFMAKRLPKADLQNLPACAADFLKLVAKKMRYCRKIRTEVMAELAAHFEDALHDCKTNDDREKKAQQLIAEFGDAKLLAILLRRAKKRCRPLWRTVIVRSFQTIGVAFICLVLYCIYLSLGKPTISVNYVQRAEEIARPVADEGLNAAPLYLEAIRLYVEEPNIAGKKLLDVIKDKPQPAGLTGEELTLMKQWIADNNNALEIFKQATNKPYCWWKRKTENEMFISVLMPELSKIRNFGKLLCWKAKVAASDGFIDEAFDDVLACYRAGMHFKGQRTLVEQLVGIAIEALACNASFTILQEKEPDSSTLQAFQGEFEKLIASDTFTIDFEVEKFFVYDFIQRYFTDNGCGSGHFIPDKTSLGFALLMADRRETVEKFDKAYEKIEQWTKTTPWQRHQANIDIERELGLNKKNPLEFWRHPYYYLLMPKAPC